MDFPVASYSLFRARRDSGIGAEKAAAGQEFVFLNSFGTPLTSQQVTWAFESATYRFTGIAMNPHMVRTIWATEYIKSTKNFIDAAYMLGDTVETVLHSYANLLDEDCGKRASLALKNIEQMSRHRRMETVSSPTKNS